MKNYIENIKASLKSVAEIDLRKLYQSNERFRVYVDRCATTYGVAAEDILSHALTR